MSWHKIIHALFFFIFLIILTSFPLTSIFAQVNAKDCSRTSVGFIPLTDMSATQNYHGEEGGLYGGGQNQPPSSHYQKAVEATNNILPRDANGNPSANGKIGVISLGMSNTRREFNTFMPIANSDPSKSPSVIFINGAQESMVACSWAQTCGSDLNPWSYFNDRITSAGLTNSQVQVVWMKITNAGPDQPGNDDHPVFAQKMRDDMAIIVQRLKRDYPNISIVYLTSRVYAGYSTHPLSPEPSCYEGAFAIRWLIDDQIAEGGVTQTTYTNAPVLFWGPYMWADGLNPRSDGLIWRCEDTVTDGVHPSDSGKEKISEMLLNFFKTDSLAQAWFFGGTIPSVSISPSPTPTTQPNVPGDGNGDGLVDGEDFIIWLVHYGQNVSGAQNGDYDDSGQVTISDYTIWLDNFGL